MNVLSREKVDGGVNPILRAEFRPASWRDRGTGTRDGLVAYGAGEGKLTRSILAAVLVRWDDWPNV